MKIARISVFALLAVLVAACQSKHDYRFADSSVGESLELPPDLSGAQVESKFELPAAISGDDESAKDKIPVLARVQSVQLQGSGDFYKSMISMNFYLRMFRQQISLNRPQLNRGSAVKGPGGGY